jgi:hypothetical protein
MAETLFTDIINNLGKAKKEGKISGGYRYKDGKLNIGGGYYGDDSMFEIDINKDGGNILFKKRFADGGSTNGSGEKAFSAKVKELMDDGYDFGEAVKEAMRQGYAKAGLVDPDNKVKKGQELGKGISQRVKYINKQGKPVIRYVTSAVGDTVLQEHKTYTKAKDVRENLIKKYKIGEVKDYKGKYNYKDLIKDKDFEKFWKAKVDAKDADSILQGQGSREGIQKVIKKHNLKPNDYEGIFNKLLEEVRISEAVRKGRGKLGQTKLVSPAIVDNLMETFKNAYKPNIGTIDTKAMGKLLKLSDGELEKLMTFIDKDYPDEKLRLEKSSDVSRTTKAAALKNKLKAAGITFKKHGRTGEGSRYRFKLDKDINKADKKFKQLEKSKTFGFSKEYKTPKYPKDYKEKFTTLSKQSAEYKMQGYNKDRGTIFRLTKALNNAIKGMTDAQLKTFINKNPKIKNLVTSFFNSRTGNIENIPLSQMTMSQIRQNLQFQQDHIRGRSTVKYDAGTKKILDGLGIEYPKNLYIIPKAVNMSTKQRVENYVYDNPEDTKTIKKIDKYFKDNKLTYYDRRNKKYRGAKPSKSAVDLAQLGFTKTSQLKDLFTGTYKDSKGKNRVITKDVAKLISDLNERNKARGGTTLEDDIKIVQKAAANQGVRFNSFAGFMDFTEMGIELPPAVKQAAARILDVGGKTLRGFGKAAVVLDPMFAAYDFSTAVGQGAGLKNSTEYMVKRFGEGVS